MAFTLPDFNITVNIFDRTPFPWVTPRLSPLANLAFSRRESRSTFEWNSDDWGLLMYLLFPQGTDVRDNSGFGASAASADAVEAPAGSGRFYLVTSVDDIGKGFPNEHRCALLVKAFENQGGTGTFPGLLWPIPMP